MADTKIAWTEKSWNPVVGCTKVSPGCDNCYAERMAVRQGYMEEKREFDRMVNDKVPIYPKYRTVANKKGWTGKTYCDESALDKPLHWKKPRRIFVDSMGDLFHPSVPFDFIDRVWWTMSVCREHIFQILTKRPERYLEYWQHRLSKGFTDGNRANIWAGITAENREWWEKRKKDFFNIPAAVHFVSNEPLLSEIKYTDEDLKRLDWVIVGAESGPKRRFCKPEWVRSLVKQCKDANTACFVKQTHLMGCRKCGFAPCTHLAGHKPKIFLIKDTDGWPRDYPEARP